jgi:hypothetical protein
MTPPWRQQAALRRQARAAWPRNSAGRPVAGGRASPRRVPSWQRSSSPPLPRQRGGAMQSYRAGCKRQAMKRRWPLREDEALVARTLTWRRSAMRVASFRAGQGDGEWPGARAGTEWRCGRCPRRNRAYKRESPRDDGAAPQRRPRHAGGRTLKRPPDSPAAARTPRLKPWPDNRPNPPGPRSIERGRPCSPGRRGSAAAVPPARRQTPAGRGRRGTWRLATGPPRPRALP